MVDSTTLLDALRELIREEIKAQAVAPPQREWFSPEQAANFLSCSKGMLEKKRRDGGGPAFVKRGKLVRYHYSALDVYLVKGRTS